MQACNIIISLATQRLDLIKNGRCIRSYSVSTSLRGPGFEPGSLKTPTGRFVIAEKIGAAAPLRSVFKSRRPTGQLGSPSAPDDYVQTRILWLDGLDKTNANTRSRYIYLHGTNHETQLGIPSSHGCIRMGNAEVAELFEAVNCTTGVLIQK